MSTFQVIQDDYMNHFTLEENNGSSSEIKEMNYSHQPMDTFLRKIRATLKGKKVQWEGPTLIHELYPDEVEGWDHFRHTSIQYKSFAMKEECSYEYMWYIHPDESQRLFCLFTDGSFYKVSAEESGEPPLVRSFHTEKEASAALFNMIQTERLRALL